MKLKYEKPSMVIEKFEMCQNIAYGCGLEDMMVEPTLRKSSDCAWQNPEDDVWLWHDAKNGCEGSPETIYEDICYNASSLSIVPFAS